MKKTYCLLFLILLSIIANSQTIEELDKKKGFKDFKIGDDLSKWNKNELLFIANSGGNSEQKIYKYNGSCCKKAFQYSIQNILLIFEKNKLKFIKLILEQQQKKYEISGEYTEIDLTHLQRLRKSFIILFGKSTDFYANDEEGKFTYLWQGNEVNLLLRWEYLGVKSGDKLTIDIAKKRTAEDIKNGF